MSERIPEPSPSRFGAGRSAWWLAASLASTLLVVPTGCGYLSRRALDLADVISVGFSDGGGIAARVAPTRLVTLEVGFRKDETFYGFRKGHFHWVESSYGLPFSFFWSSRLGAEPFKEWLWTDIFRTSHSKVVFPDPAGPYRISTGYEERSYHFFLLTQRDGARLVDELDLEFEASALLAGIQVVVSPGELVDFLAGIFAVDLAGDDDRGRRRAEAPGEGDEEPRAPSRGTERMTSEPEG